MEICADHLQHSCWGWRVMSANKPFAHLAAKDCRCPTLCVKSPHMPEDRISSILKNDSLRLALRSHFASTTVFCVNAKSAPTPLDNFCGFGCLSLGAEQTRFRCVTGLVNAGAEATFRAHFPCMGEDRVCGADLILCHSAFLRYVEP